MNYSANLVLDQVAVSSIQTDSTGHKLDELEIGVCVLHADISYNGNMAVVAQASLEVLCLEH